MEKRERSWRLGGPSTLLVVHEQPWPLVDLRVDWEENPVRKLRELWVRYEPQIKTFLLWALSPDEAPPFQTGDK